MKKNVTATSPLKFVYLGPVDKWIEVREWFYEFCPFENIEIISCRFESESLRAYSFTFADKDINWAMLFKLTWCDNG